MKRRPSRAKTKKGHGAIPFPVPAAHLLPDRLDAVLAVVYLIYNEGYGGRVDVAAEAVRLERLLATLMPDEPEVHGLLALMLVQHARRAALTGSPVVELNRAVAIAQSGDTQRALEIVERLELDDYQYLHSTRAELLHRLGRDEDAHAAYRRALQLTLSPRERRFLERRLAEL